MRPAGERAYLFRHPVQASCARALPDRATILAMSSTELDAEPPHAGAWSGRLRGAFSGLGYLAAVETGIVIADAMASYVNVIGFESPQLWFLSVGRWASIG